MAIAERIQEDNSDKGGGHLFPARGLRGAGYGSLRGGAFDERTQAVHASCSGRGEARGRRGEGDVIRSLT